MKPAVLIIDMLEDSFNEQHRNPVTPFALEIVPRINRLTQAARGKGIPVIFSMDSFLPGDFIFKGKMREHSIRGTAGAEVYRGLTQEKGDMYSRKRRFSAFFKTDLDQTLRLHGVDTVALAGINSHWCVLSSALDALANDFRAYIIEDCAASYSRQVHETAMDMYRRNPLFPLFKIMKLDEFLGELGGEPANEPANEPD